MKAKRIGLGCRVLGHTFALTSGGYLCVHCGHRP